MASSFNSVTLVGRLGKDPEMRYTPNGNAVTSFTMATDRDGKSEETDWHNIICWQKLAEVVNEHLTKGRLVLIEGRLQYSEWEKDGVKKRRAEVVANTVKFLDSNKNGSQSNGGGERRSVSAGAAKHDDFGPEPKW